MKGTGQKIIIYFSKTILQGKFKWVCMYVCRHRHLFLSLVLKRRFGSCNVHGRNDVAQLGHTFRISRLVVVPGIDFHQRTVDDLGWQGIDDRASGIVRVIGTDKGFLC
jgi:hypothetical protein